MSDYKRLLDYIPYFENEYIEFYKWESGYPVYDDKLNEFINDAYESDRLRGDYLDYLHEQGINEDLSAAISTADLELLTSILTYYVRQERFCDGMWGAAVKEKVFLRILYRLKELNS
jgi:hypothetical protein